VNGRKRHILVDTQGNLLKVKVHAANIQDRDGGQLLLESIPDDMLCRFKKIWADGGYRGRFVDWVFERKGWIVEVVKKLDKKGFSVLPRRWVVERTFAWTSKCRRLSKDYEQRCESEEAWFYLSMSCILLNRIVPPPKPVWRGK
jgi:putative transposase